MNQIEPDDPYPSISAPAKCSGIRWDQEMGSIHSQPGCQTLPLRKRLSSGSRRRTMRVVVKWLGTMAWLPGSPGSRHWKEWPPTPPPGGSYNSSFGAVTKFGPLKSQVSHHLKGNKHFWLSPNLETKPIVPVDLSSRQQARHGERCCGLGIYIPCFDADTWLLVGDTAYFDG